MQHPVFVIPEAMQTLQSLSKVVTTNARRSGVTKELLDLIHLRASQINGCSVCIDLHTRDAVRAGVSNERLWTVAAWRDTPYFTDAERAALALTEAVTRLSDRPDPVPDAIWDEAARYYDEQALASLVLAIASINVWNRLNVTTHQVVEAWAP
jgi:AhpD family alkylhydroperoxidase